MTFYAITTVFFAHVLHYVNCRVFCFLQYECTTLLPHTRFVFRVDLLMLLAPVDFVGVLYYLKLSSKASVWGIQLWLFLFLTVEITEVPGGHIMLLRGLT